ncbi:MAG: ABC transporter ATP-binding protein [Thermoleophilia bacterium]|nr:ABC transporter ATP-binding protein [Thermoleophilia bacterium]
MLSARGLAKRYRRVVALEPTDLDLAPGESVALIGPNGAGKTTLLRMLAGVSRPSEGTLTVAAGTAARVGWVPQRPALYQRLTCRENLRLFAALEGVPDPEGRAERLLERADLVRFADRQAAHLSTGTMQRLNLAIALAGEPSVLLLDEPTATLSPEQVHRLWTWLTRLCQEDGLAMAFSTQSVDEAARHAGRVVVLSHGRAVFDGTMRELVREEGGDPDDRDAAERAFLRLVGEDG